MNEAHAEAVIAGLVKELHEQFGDRLASVVLYGSVPRQESVLGLSDVNLLVILDRVVLKDLEMAAPVVRPWVDAGRALPMLFGVEEFHTATDAFAIEMADLLDRRDVVHGADPLVDVVVPPHAIRHQLEHELRARYAQLREGLLLAVSRPKAIGELLITSIPAFVCYMRAILRLTGRTVPGSSEDVIRAAANVIDAAPEPFLAVWNARIAGAELRLPIDAPIVRGYDDLVARAVRWIDDLSPETGRSPDRNAER